MGSGNATEVSFLDYLRPVWRFKYGVVLLIIAAAAGTYVFYDRQDRVYETTTQLYVGQSDLQGLLGSGGASASTDRSIANQARLVSAPRVARGVARSLKLNVPPEALLGSITSLPNTNSDFLTIGAESHDPQLAANLANGFASEYLRVKRGDVVSTARAALRKAEGQVGKLRSQGSPAAREALREQIATLQSATLSPPSPGTQLSVASVPSSPVRPNPKRNALFAAALALVLGIIIAYLLDRSDRRVRRLEDMELFDLPILATVPHVRRVGPFLRYPGSTPASLREPHRALRVNLDLARAEGGAEASKVLMITSALPGEGKSTIVRNLAISYREAGARVAVVEADLRRPVLAERFGLDDRLPGLGDALEVGGKPNTLHVVDETESSGSIELIAAGIPRENPTILLTEEKLRPLVGRLRSEHDLVLLDAPPLLAVSDGLPLLSIADAVVLVLRGGTTTHPALDRLRRTIDRVPGVKMLGVVANDVSDNLASYYSFNDRRQTNGASAPSNQTSDAPSS